MLFACLWWFLTGSLAITEMTDISATSLSWVHCFLGSYILKAMFFQSFRMGQLCKQGAPRPLKPTYNAASGNNLDRTTFLLLWNIAKKNRRISLLYPLMSWQHLCIVFFFILHCICLFFVHDFTYSLVLTRCFCKSACMLSWSLSVLKKVK